MNNTALKDRNWQYIDVDAFEYEIRKDERLKMRKRLQERRKRQQERKKQRIKDCLVILFQKTIGLLLIALLVFAFNYGYFYEPEIQANDGTPLIILVPLALFLIFSNKRWIYL